MAVNGFLAISNLETWVKIVALRIIPFFTNIASVLFMIFKAHHAARVVASDALILLFVNIEMGIAFHACFLIYIILAVRNRFLGFFASFGISTSETSMAILASSVRKISLAVNIVAGEISEAGRSNKKQEHTFASHYKFNQI